MHIALWIYSLLKKVSASPSGNRTPVSRVTGGDTYHYTIEDNWKEEALILIRLSIDSLMHVYHCSDPCMNLHCPNSKDASTTKLLTQFNIVE